MIKELLNTTENRALIQKLLDYAEANKVNQESVKLMIAGKMPPVGDDENFRIQINNFKIVYSLEWNPNGWVKHLSISENNNLPDEDDAKDIAEVFNYDFEDEIYAYEENYINLQNENVSAFNVLQLLVVVE